jgi:hypothetical protein
VSKNGKKHEMIFQYFTKYFVILIGKLFYEQYDLGRISKNTVIYGGKGPGINETRGKGYGESRATY